MKMVVHRFPVVLPYVLEMGPVPSTSVDLPYTDAKAKMLQA
jgi:hypothetical protein